MKNNSRQVKSPYIGQFHLFMDDQGLLKCKGTINNVGLSATEKTPCVAAIQASICENAGN